MIIIIVDIRLQIWTLHCEKPKWVWWEETAKDLTNVDSDIYKYKQQEHPLLKAFFSILCFEEDM